MRATRFAAAVLLSAGSAPGWATSFSNPVISIDPAENTAGGTNVLTSAEANGGIANTGFGKNAAHAVTSGNSNSAFGYYALGNDTTGSSNSAFGYGALDANGAGNNDTAAGFKALFSNTTG